MDNIINLDFSNSNKPEEGVDFYETRKIFAESFNPKNIIISVVTWNQLEKTKKCVEYLLKYTSHIEFNLVFFDNNSEDDTIEFLKSVEHPNKTIFSSNKNMGIAFALNYLISTSKCEYYININNDCYVTHNWLDNILACFKSDERIAFISPMSSNMSNHQNPLLEFNSLEEMQEVAKDFNKLDHQKWFEKRRLIGAVTCYRKHIFDLIGIMDSGFIHNFSDDDISMRIARSGYKQMLAGDVFIHHDHDYSKQDMVELNQNLMLAKDNFRYKYNGIDGWDDLNNYELNLISLADYSNNDNNVLGIDIRCGTPLFEIKNNFRMNSNFDCSLYAFTTHAKYYNDLTFVCEDQNNVVCDRIEYISEHYFQGCLDIIILGECINSYSKPIKLLETLTYFLKDGGQILFKLKNLNNWVNFLNMIGQTVEENSNDKEYVNISPEILFDYFNKQGYKMKGARELEAIPKNTKEKIESKCLKIPVKKVKNFENIYVNEYLFCLTK